MTTSHTPWGSLRRPTRFAWAATAGRDDAVVAVSGAVAESLPRRARERAVVIPHGIDTDAVERALKAAAERNRPPAGSDGAGAGHEVLAVTVASHRDAKNYPNLLRAIGVARRAGAPVRLVCFGDGPNLERHRNLVTQLGLAEAVTFEPARDDVLAAIAAADLLVVASDYEGQPIVVAEALALGVPVVATAVGRVPELVNSDVGRVVAPGDPVALGGALAELATSPELRASMSVTARQQRNAWTLDDVVAAHLDLYRSVVDARNGGRASASRSER